MNKWSAGSITYRFLLLFCLYFGLFYGCSYFVIGATSPGRLYSPLIYEHFDFIEAFRGFLLRSASFLLDAVGIINNISGHTIKVPGKVSINVHPACMGIGIISFWWAIVLAFPNGFRLKSRFLLLGSTGLITLNILRIFALGYIYSIGLGQRYSSVDHHLVFNVIIYVILAAMTVRWLNMSDKTEKSLIGLPVPVPVN